MLLNNSRYKEFQECPRKSAIHRILRLESEAKSNELAFGIAMHEGLASIYLGNSLEQSIMDFIGSYKAEGNPMNLDEYLPHQAMGQTLLRAYNNRDYCMDDFGVVQVESRFAVILGEECYNCHRKYKSELYQPDYTMCPCGMPIFGLAGQADLVVTRRNKYVIVDHKTTASIGKEYLASWGHDFGMIGYCYGTGKALGKPIQRFGMNIIKKLKTVEKDSKTCPDCRNGSRKKLLCLSCNKTGRVPMQPPKAFYREFYTVADQDFRAMIDNRIALGLGIWNQGKMFEGEPGAQRKHLFPMNSTTCHKYGTVCDYIPCCWENNPDNAWWDIPEVLNAHYITAPEDYVDKLVKEDMG